jgi:GTP-binding protein
MQNEFLIMIHTLQRPYKLTRKEGEIGQRNNGSLISMTQGQAVAYAIFNLQKSGKFFVEHNTDIYEGVQEY